MALGEFTQFQVPTRIVGGCGLASDFAAEWSTLGVRKPMLVTDTGIQAAGLVDRVCSGLEAAGVAPVAVFADVPPNSDVECIKACAALATAKGADSFVAVGGGSVIDTAKLAALLFTHGGDLVEDYVGAQTVPGAIAPLVGIPTTAGTGSEVTLAAVVHDAAAQRKLSFVDDHLRPRLAILDPALTVGLPAKLTAATGMDATTHAIEAFVDVQRGVFSDACAIQTLRLINQHLVRATRDGSNIDARGGMLAAATMAGIAIDHSMVGVVHAVSHALGGLTSIHHGTANAICLPLGFAYNWEVSRDRYAALARAVGLSTACDDQEAACALREWTTALREELYQIAGLSRTLQEEGIDRQLIAQVAQIAEEDGASFYNPRPVEAAAIHALLEEQWG